MSERLHAAFPGLRTTPVQVTSPSDAIYNCIAWAAGHTSAWWWPFENNKKTYWPPDVPREHTINTFISAFQTLGYTVCADEFAEPGFEKVAVFADANGAPTHAARQLPTGRWTSKLGQEDDVEHDLRALQGKLYGSVAVMLKRPTS